MALYDKPAEGGKPLKYCNTCRHLRPPRTHHCRTCNKCVIRFDHHCIWLNNCIGLGNLRYFMSFVGQSMPAAFVCSAHVTACSRCCHR